MYIGGIYTRVYLRVCTMVVYPGVYLRVCTMVVYPGYMGGIPGWYILLFAERPLLALFSRFTVGPEREPQGRRRATYPPC